VGGRQSHQAYWQWEKDCGGELVDEHLATSGDLDRKTVLDIGCGLGGKSMAYGEAGASAIWGIDISVENVIASQEFAAPGDRSFRCEFMAAAASSLPLQDRSFDTVIGNDVMEHFAEPEKSIGEMVRVTRPGGVIWIFFTPYYSPLGSHLYDFIYTPWCNIILSRSQMEAAIRRVVSARMTEAPAGDVDREVNRIMDFYDHGLNRMSIRRFQRTLRDFPGLRVTHREFKPAKFPFLSWLTSLPLVRELFTGQAVYRLQRIDPSAR
jgi:ubiquinone/menaquinone biosynthesis C-methylase UbiE